MKQNWFKRIVYILIACLLSFSVAHESKPGTTVIIAAEVKETEPSEAELAEQVLTDEQLLFRLANVYAVFREHASSLWSLNYQFDKKPLMLVYRTPTAELSHAYLINHPTAASLPSAELFKTDPELNLPPVYKLTELPDVAKKVQNFDFQADIAGTASFIMAYTAESVDAFSAPVSADWDAFLVHEGLHDQQFETWKTNATDIQDEAGYPLEADDIADIQLESKLLIDALKTEDLEQRDEALKRFVAVRSERMNKSDIVAHMDGPQERYEGTARYLEYQLAAFIPNKDQYGMIPYLELSLDAKVGRDELAFGRFYSTGAALSELLDRLELDWKAQLEAGKTQFDVLNEHYALVNNSERQAELLTEARAAYDYVSLQEDAIETAKHVDDDYVGFDGFPDDMGSEGFEGFSEEIQKPYETLTDTGPLASVPEGYALLGVFSASQDELDEFVQKAFSPEGNDIKVFDYASQKDRLRVVSSTFTGDAKTMKKLDWYAESEFIEIASTPALLYSFNEDDWSYSEIAFIHDGRWYNISAGLSTEQLIAIAQELISSS